jgi:hypothetical protein
LKKFYYNYIFIGTFVTLGLSDLTITLSTRYKLEEIHAIVVIRTGFEPVTNSLEGCCSIQLSYRTIIRWRGICDSPFLLLNMLIKSTSQQQFHFRLTTTNIFEGYPYHEHPSASLSVTAIPSSRILLFPPSCILKNIFVLLAGIEPARPSLVKGF